KGCKFAALTLSHYLAHNHLPSPEQLLSPGCLMSFVSMALTLAATAILLFSSAVSAINPIVVKGNAFFDSKTNQRFYIRGLDYQLGGSSLATTYDPLADSAGCDRDVAAFKSLGINTIRVYSILNNGDHSHCMNLLADAGIYLILDVNTPLISINRANPASSYNAVLLQNIFATIDAFSSYDNVLGFFAGNEVVNDVATVEAAPYVKAVVRDMKAYIAKQSKRTIPVGYSAASVAENRGPLAFYLNAGEDDTRIDFYGLNSYEWCGASSYTISGYDQFATLFQGLTIPLFFSEYGCNKPAPRTFTEVEAIYSTQMTSFLSGGLVYEYSQEANSYGLVQISTDKKSVSYLTDFNNLKAEFAKTPNPSGDGGYNASITANNYPSNTTNFEVTTIIPPMPEAAKIYLQKGAGTPLGNTGPSNQGYATDVPSAGSGSKVSTASGSTTSSNKKGAAGRVMVTIPSIFIVLGVMAIVI
ncbi:1,3-beta-glucanosyltransferase gas4, partial [Neolecta irregularis DAH-3]